MTVLVMQADITFWDSLVFDGMDDVDVEEVTAAFGTIDILARGRAAGARVRAVAGSLIGCTTPTSAGSRICRWPGRAL